MMRKMLLAGLIITLALLAISSARTIEIRASTPVPLVTLVPPTLVPSPIPATVTPPPTQSALAGIKANNRLTVGILYNIGRFATLTDTGNVDGFEAAIAQAIAEDWGVNLQFKQVTRQNAVNLLLGGQIDLLMGEVMLSRDMESQIDYSDALFVNKEVALVNTDAGAKNVNDLANQKVGVVFGSRAEQSIQEWMQANNVQITVSRYAMLDGADGALRALSSKQIAAVVADRWELDQKVSGLPGLKLLDGAFRAEPYAIAMRRYDDNLRTLVNRTLQRLVQSKRLDPIYDAWFPTNLMPTSDRMLPRVWSGLDTDTRALADFSTDIVMPSQPVVARITSHQPLRVAGFGAPPDSTGKSPVLENFNQALINEMARRWGAQVQPVADSFGKGEDAVAGGQADLAVGLEPHWAGVDRVDFAGIYAEHSYRIMVPFGSTAIKTFNDLFATRRQIGYYADDPGVIDVFKKLADTVKIAQDSIKPIKLQSDQDAIQVLVTDHNADIVFGDSLRLIPVVQAYPKYVQLTDGQYGGAKAISFAVPRNDADFRVLVEVTLQEMYRDGTYQKIYNANFGVGNPLNILVWPGASTLFGVKTNG